MFTASDKVKPNMGNIRGLNLAVGRVTSKLLYYQKGSQTKPDPLCKAWTDTDPDILHTVHTSKYWKCLM